jgi:hypothetical protein
MLVTREHLVTGGILYMTLEGPTTWGLGALARFLGRAEDARSHYEHAFSVSGRACGRPVQALIACDYASLLARSPDRAERERALALARQARATAEELGMRALRVAADGLHAELEGETKARGTFAAPDELTMSQAGDSWVVRYGDSEFHLRDVQGVRLLATLVAEPGREFHVLDLSRSPRFPLDAIDRGDAGEALDDEAKRQYRARIAEINEDLREAEDWNDLARADRARREIARIEQELSRAVGLGGRDRRARVAAERARVNVQRRIRDAIRRIEGHHPGLAKHLDRAVRTGTYCAYEP